MHASFLYMCVFLLKQHVLENFAADSYRASLRILTIEYSDQIFSQNSFICLFLKYFLFIPMLRDVVLGERDCQAKMQLHGDECQNHQTRG